MAPTRSSVDEPLHATRDDVLAPHLVEFVVSRAGQNYTTNMNVSSVAGATRRTTDPVRYSIEKVHI